MQRKNQRADKYNVVLNELIAVGIAYYENIQPRYHRNLFDEIMFRKEKLVSRERGES